MPRKVFIVEVIVTIDYPEQHTRVQRDAETVVQDRLQLGLIGLHNKLSYYENTMRADGLGYVRQMYVKPASGVPSPAPGPEPR
jgi:hypothetical protein